MQVQPHSNSTKIPRWSIYPSLFVIGILLLLLCSLLQHTPAPMKDEYYYSYFFSNNYTLLAQALFFITGLFVGYFFQLNPWYAGICLNLIFPFTSIVEGMVYKGSHNLIPVEFAFQLWFALPSIVAVYIGRFLFRQVEKRKVKVEGEVVESDV